jgi:cell division protein FtsX
MADIDAVFGILGTVTFEQLVGIAVAVTVAIIIFAVGNTVSIQIGGRRTIGIAIARSTTKAK